jgi:hypothetical protein
LGNVINLFDDQTNALTDQFDHLVKDLIYNDYSIMEGQTPPGDGPGDGPERILFDELLEKVKEPSLIRMKSVRGNLQPGLETVGAQALTLLSALRVAEKKCRNPFARDAYRKMLYKYGYGVLSLIPTSFIPSARGYFNDSNCMAAAYTLAKLADSRAGRLFWGIPLFITWSLSYKWYNGYFTGLLVDAIPELKPYFSNYMAKCWQYLHEESPRYFAQACALKKEPDFYPVHFNKQEQEQFHPDQAHLELVKEYDGQFLPTENTRSGLGWLAHAIMLKPELVKRAYEELELEVKGV